MLKKKTLDDHDEENSVLDHQILWLTPEWNLRVLKVHSRCLEWTQLNTFGDESNKAVPVDHIFVQLHFLPTECELLHRNLNSQYLDSSFSNVFVNFATCSILTLITEIYQDHLLSEVRS